MERLFSDLRYSVRQFRRVPLLVGAIELLVGTSNMRQADMSITSGAYITAAILMFDQVGRDVGRYAVILRAGRVMLPGGLDPKNLHRMRHSLAIPLSH
jgi:hypothetical protein